MAKKSYQVDVVVPTEHPSADELSQKLNELCSNRGAEGYRLVNTETFVYATDLMSTGHPAAQTGRLILFFESD